MTMRIIAHVCTDFLQTRRCLLLVLVRPSAYNLRRRLRQRRLAIRRCSSRMISFRTPNLLPLLLVICRNTPSLYFIYPFPSSRACFERQHSSTWKPLPDPTGLTFSNKFLFCQYEYSFHSNLISVLVLDSLCNRPRCVQQSLID